ncbi:MAG: glycosyltransferase family 4 protein [Proteobacteria bacterium]|nr:glycosyltransferase family 4 protein [Pseudomonadota bacterium]
MKVLFIAKGNDDPATRYRVMPVLSRLHQLKIETGLCDDSDGIKGKLRLLCLAKDAQLLFIQRKLFTPWFIRLLKSRCNNIVFDFDDAIFCRSNGEVSASRMRKFKGMLESSTLVFAGNEYLAEQCTSVETLIVPTSVDEARYSRNVEKESGCVLVWIGSSSTRKYLEHHRSVLEEVGDRFPNVSLKVIADFDFHLVNMKVSNVPWSIESEASQLASAHIGIAPMIDNPWTNGKCALKIVQYMAAGLPVISSRIGANREVVVPGETGLLADTVDEWMLAVESLAGNQGERDRMGLAGYNRMSQKYSQEVVLDSIIGNLTARQLIPAD